MDSADDSAGIATLTLVIVVALVTIDVAVRVLAIIFVPRDRRPQTAAAWLLAIFFIPLFYALVRRISGVPMTGKKDGSTALEDREEQP